MSRAGLGTRILLIAGGVLFIDLLLHWQQACFGGGEGIGKICGHKSGFSGFGVLVGILVLAMIAWEAAQLANVALPSLPVPATMISAALAGVVTLFTIILFFSHNEARHWPAWIGLILAFVIGYGAFLKFNEAGGADAIPRNPSAPPPAV